MSYYEGSELTIEWTAQHSCGLEGKADCQLIIQYLCGDTSIAAGEGANEYIRDGTDTGSISGGGEADTRYMEVDVVSSLGAPVYKYGMHESYDFYQACSTRQRNAGLFTSNENINGNSARFTRQNNNGNQHGFECAEERDYYPYWHPTPWRDIAILTSDISMCDWYKENSQNNNKSGLSWGYCVTKDDPPAYAQENNEKDCGTAGYSWLTFGGHDIDAPDCLEHPWQRDNHLGNAMSVPRSQRAAPSVHAAHYNWSLPKSGDLACIKTGSCACVLRMRYNMSSWEIDGFAPGGVLGDTKFHDSSYNDEAAPFKNDPYVEVSGATVALEMNTREYGRTFQDRSYVFEIMERPSIAPGSTIYNLNVRGKRGNIVQAYPAVEYDFVPVALHVRQYDFIHFQWTGCDTNPNGNAGQGLDGTDRSNIVQIENLNANMPMTEDQLKESGNYLFKDLEQRNLMAYLGQTACAGNGDDQQDPQNCYYLNAAGAYFNGGLLKMNNTGTFYYMCTRNNNFSNRSHKATIVVHFPLTDAELAGVIIAGVALIAIAFLGLAAFYGKSHPHSLAGRATAKATSCFHNRLGLGAWLAPLEHRRSEEAACCQRPSSADFQIKPQDGLVASVENWRGGKEKAGAKTRVIDKTLDPEWNETFHFILEDRLAPLKLELWDKDRLTKDDPLGHVILKVADLAPGKDEDLELNVENGDGKLFLQANLADDHDSLSFDKVALGHPGGSMMGNQRGQVNGMWGHVGNPDNSVLVAKGILLVKNSIGNIVQVVQLDAMSVMGLTGSCHYEMCDERMIARMQAGGANEYLQAVGAPPIGAAFAQPEPKAEYKLDVFDIARVEKGAKLFFKPMQLNFNKNKFAPHAGLFRLGFQERADRDRLAAYLEAHHVQRYLIVKNLGDDPCTPEGIAAIQKRQLAAIPAPLMGLVNKTGMGQMMNAQMAGQHAMAAGGAMNMDPCASCGTLIQATTAFCSKCGTKNQHYLSPEDVAARAAAAGHQGAINAPQKDSSDEEPPSN